MSAEWGEVDLVDLPPRSARHHAVTVRKMRTVNSQETGPRGLTYSRRIVRRGAFLLRRFLLHGVRCWGPQEVRYGGEFGRELRIVVPYAYWLFRRGRLRRTVSVRDTRCFYFFSPEHVELDVPRRPMHVRDFPLYTPFPRDLDTWRWTPPPYRAHYANPRFRWDRPTVVIANKYSSEWGGPPVNFLDLPTLRALVERLRGRYRVVYNRADATAIPRDHQAVLAWDDLEFLRQNFPEVILLPLLRREVPELTYNELQCRVYANCERFISVQGGPSVLASYFGGVNILFARQGSELHRGVYRWFPQLSGCDVVPVGTPERLLAEVERRFLTS